MARVYLRRPLEPQLDHRLEASRRNLPGVLPVGKFGRSPNVDNGVDTDIHDGANATDNVDIWVAPTAARVHQITSTSASDTGGGAGARTIRVWGLTSWTSPETSEVITMNGVGNVPTASAYVIIHRMKVLTKGATSSNVGTITATADTDGTVTAQITATMGRTLMAIYGWPRGRTAHITNYYGSAIKGGATGFVDLSLLVNEEPDAELLNFSVLHDNGITTDGSNYVPHRFDPYERVVGPAILKIRANASANDTIVSAGFGLYLEPS